VYASTIGQYRGVSCLQTVTVHGSPSALNGIHTENNLDKSGIFVNGQFPGPTIEANWGDWIEVTVHNNISGSEGTAIHWHGMTQKGRLQVTSFIP
jgi:FtsP/CotA-like multicopper oxidase with cupredoxin domain